MKLNDYEFFNFAKKGLNNVNYNNFTPTIAQQEIYDRLNSEIEDYNSRVINGESELDFNEQLTCNYYDVDEFRNCKFSSDRNVSIMHLNIHSVQAHIEELNTLLSTLNHTFDIIAISESKLNRDPIVDIKLTGYQTPIITLTEAAKGGTMIYVAERINFKSRKDLEIYQCKDLESTFIEIINPKESNHIIGEIYRHPNMNTSQFNDNKLNELLGKLSHEMNRKVYIAGDFNFDLLKTSTLDTSLFYEKFTSNIYSSHCLTYQN